MTKKKTPPANATPPRCATCRHYQQTCNRKPSKLDLANDPKLQLESWMYGHCLVAPPQMVKPAAWAPEPWPVVLPPELASAALVDV
jgi:hypothetical protein